MIMGNTLILCSRNTQYILAATNRVIRHSGILTIKPQGVRHLYSPATLGIDGYLQQKERTKQQFGNISTRFREKMNEYTMDDSKNMVFTEDLKNMLHLAEGDEDVKLIIKMMKRFNQQNKQMRFGSFVFGPVIMRMFHFLNKPMEAYECFKDEELEGMFDQLISYQICLDLLFENQKYNEILETFEIIKNRQIDGIKYGKNVIVLIMATCYKLNTQEMFNYASKLWQEIHEVGHLPMRRAVTFCAALAINQGKPDEALEILSACRTLNYSTVRNLRVSALVDIGRLENAIDVLKSIITEDRASTPDSIQTFSREILDKTQAAVDKLGNTAIITEFNRILKYFEEQKHISDLPFETQLCQEILTPGIIKGKINENFSRRQQQPRYSRFSRDTEFGDRRGFESRNVGGIGRFSRPGLSDL